MLVAITRKAVSAGTPRWVRLVLGTFLLASAHAAIGQGTYTGKIGVEVSERPTGFRDAFVHQGRLFLTTDGSAKAPYDANGWPTTDGLAVIFDQRPYLAWNPPMDDPDAVQPDSPTLHGIRPWMIRMPYSRIPLPCMESAHG